MAVRPAPAPTLAGPAGEGTLGRLADVWRYRDLLRNLVRTQLKVKYKNSWLGWAWSLANPALYLAVYSFVFGVVLPSGIADFPIFLLSGLLVWTFFATAVGAATGSIVGNASLVGKVWFPREILPLAAIGAALVHFVLQSTVLVVAMLIARRAPDLAYLPLLPLALLVLVLLCAALSLALAAINVPLRDTGHLLELALLAWFWATPIVYPFVLVAERATTAVALLNPITSVTLTFQRALYGEPSSGTTRVLPDEGWLWYGRNLLIVGVVSAVLLVLALRLFRRLEDTFAEGL